MIPETILSIVLDEELCPSVSRLYLHWFAFMEKHVEFWMADSMWHGPDHCARVLLLALILAHLKKLSDEDIEVLCLAAVFHDSCRQDDYTDRGHGKRAAEYYRDFCRERQTPVNQHASFIMYFHDLEDAIGLSEIVKRHSGCERYLRLYQIFKDADALDRFRLGPDALDVSMLRTNESSGLVQFSRYLLLKNKELLSQQALIA
ncbi:HD domain-containing protein [Pectobacterium brasiliense]|uniref:HD domain-containing protein n=1 Tax=Pectobacterium brasiliense TaxID=180957 RepID=UPI00227A892C|nr:HD domain-containing protein [Pectobacterium brasiliense]WGL29778.1 HD domain-containing protein [Pectobacterium brasiliense]WJM80395.1 HD domain-containing protein [Pectobacterium brasiliense]